MSAQLSMKTTITSRILGGSTVLEGGGTREGKESSTKHKNNNDGQKSEIKAIKYKTGI